MQFFEFQAMQEKKLVFGVKEIQVKFVVNCEHLEASTIGQRYTVENSSRKSNMKHFMNVIYPRILYLDEEPDTLIQHLVPPPELHIMWGYTERISR